MNIGDKHGVKSRGIFQRNWLNIANLLSILRLTLLPFFLYLAYRYSLDPQEAFFAWLLLIIFIAALTDFLDGYLARRFKQETRLGRYLDPMCDKILVISSLSLLSFSFGFPLWAYGFYLLREILSVGVGLFLYFKRNLQGEPNYLGKLAVALASLLITWYLAVPWLRTELVSGHWLLDPMPLTYLWTLILLGSMFVFGFSYWNIIFDPHSSASLKNEQDRKSTSKK